MDHIKHKQLFAGNSPTSDHWPKSKKKLLLFIAVLLIAAAATISSIVSAVRHASAHKHYSAMASLETPQSHAIIRSACSSTRYPDLCFSAVTTSPEGVDKITSQKDVIEASLNLTTKAVQHNFFVIEKLMANRGRNLTKREKTALHDCIEMIDETLDELHKVTKNLEMYPTKKTLQQHADDLLSLVSAAMTNPESCLDGFSHDDADKNVRGELIEGQVHVEKMCSNSLAMIKNMTDTDMNVDRQKTMSRKLEEKEMWPEWLSAGDRRLLQSTTVTPDVVVAADGSGNCKTVGEAVAAAPANSNKRYVIRIKAGTYRENVEVPKTKVNIMFMGDGRMTTVITGSRSVKGGSTTWESATVAAVGDRFLARDITFQNTAGPSNHQAVALRVSSDLSAFYRCDILAYQDTLYVHTNRQFYVNCLIAGTVDFIFGNAAAVFQDCDIHARRPDPGQKNMVTAQGRTDPNQVTGIVIQKCRIGATLDLLPVKGSFPTYLGRPWKEYSRTVIMQSSISDVIHPRGWYEWDGNFAVDTLYYGEYQNTGAGAGTSQRVTWKGFKVITSAAEANGFAPSIFIAGNGWLSSTGFPFSLGL